MRWVLKSTRGSHSGEIPPALLQRTLSSSQALPLVAPPYMELGAHTGPLPTPSPMACLALPPRPPAISALRCSPSGWLWEQLPAPSGAAPASPCHPQELCPWATFAYARMEGQGRAPGGTCSRALPGNTHLLHPTLQYGPDNTVSVCTG